MEKLFHYFFLCSFICLVDINHILPVSSNPVQFNAKCVAPGVCRPEEGNVLTDLRKRETEDLLEDLAAETESPTERDQFLSGSANETSQSVESVTEARHEESTPSNDLTNGSNEASSSEATELTNESTVTTVTEVSTVSQSDSETSESADGQSSTSKETVNDVTNETTTESSLSSSATESLSTQKSDTNSSTPSDIPSSTLTSSDSNPTSETSTDSASETNDSTSEVSLDSTLSSSTDASTESTKDSISEATQDSTLSSTTESNSGGKHSGAGISDSTFETSEDFTFTSSTEASIHSTTSPAGSTSDELTETSDTNYGEIQDSTSSTQASTNPNPETSESTSQLSQEPDSPTQASIVSNDDTTTETLSRTTSEKLNDSLATETPKPETSTLAIHKVAASTEISLETSSASVLSTDTSLIDPTSNVYDNTSLHMTTTEKTASSHLVLPTPVILNTSNSEQIQNVEVQNATEKLSLKQNLSVDDLFSEPDHQGTHFSGSINSSLSDTIKSNDSVHNGKSGGVLESVEPLFDEDGTTDDTSAADNYTKDYDVALLEKGNSFGCLLEDREKFKRGLTATVYSQTDGEPTMLTFLQDEFCMGTLSKTGRYTLRSRGILLPQLPLNIDVEAGMFMHDRLYLFDSSPAQRVWSFKYESAKRTYSLKSHSIISTDAFLQVCGIKNHPTNNFRVKAIAQVSLKDPTCIVYDQYGRSYLSQNPSPEAVSLVMSIQYLVDTQYIIGIQSIFSWLDEPFTKSVYVYGSNGELYELYRNASNNLWPIGNFRIIPYEKFPIPHN